jgi:hypothetical protein
MGGEALEGDFSGLRLQKEVQTWEGSRSGKIARRRPRS